MVFDPDFADKQHSPILGVFYSDFLYEMQKDFVKNSKDPHHFQLCVQDFEALSEIVLQNLIIRDDSG